MVFEYIYLTYAPPVQLVLQQQPMPQMQPITQRYLNCKVLSGLHFQIARVLWSP